MKSRITTFLLALTLVFSTNTKADEGMWMLPMLEKLNMGTMTELGLKLSAEEIFSLNQPSIKDAIVIFGGGCTGEIVSSQGLLLTNHHCGYGQIQAHSSVEHDYLKDGFWAMSLEEELPNPNLSVTFLRHIEDVTDQVNKVLKEGMTEEERNEAIRDVNRKIVKKAGKDNNYSSRVYSFFGGNYFYLISYETYRDVRFVGAPPSSIGKFGGDTDNWEWPRHTGDFSVFRVYSAADGTPADYSEQNVPLNPKYHLPVSIQGVQEDDFAMVLGYPGGTQRYMTSWEIDEVLSITHPNRIKIRGIRQEILMKDMQADPKVRIQYASKYSGSSNYWKFSIGQSEILKKLNVKADKQQLQDEFRSWVAEDSKRREKYGEALSLIRNAIEGRAEYAHARQYASECFLRGCEIIGYARSFAGFAEQIENDKEKAQQTAENISSRMGEIFKNYNPPTDKKSVKAMLQLYREEVPQKYHPEFYQVVDKDFNGSVSDYVDHMFEVSVYADEDRLLAAIEDLDAEKLKNDPAFMAASSVMELYGTLGEKYSSFSSDLNRGHRLFVAGVLEMKPNTRFYPDANFTMRLTYGTVQPYDPRDAVTYDYKTTLEGVMEKEVPGDYEFDVPAKLKEIYEARDYGRYANEEGNMPVCFITNNDITGGNSGSPVLNANGELIGLAFDGNWEAMSGDIAFEPELQRCIVVDIRYVLMIMDKYAGARHLVEEMTLRQ